MSVAYIVDASVFVMEEKPPSAPSSDIKPVALLLVLLGVIAAAIYFLPSEPSETLSKVKILETFDNQTIEDLLSSGWVIWYNPSMVELTGLSVGYPEETWTITEHGILCADKGAGGLFYMGHEGSDFRLSVSTKWEGGP